jgi:hypothetical protein
MRPLYLLLVLGVASGTALAQEATFPPLIRLQESDTFRVARLTPSEQQQVFEEVAEISFDTPDSWESELLVRRVKLGGLEEGLVLQGTRLLCGATGNCETFVLRRMNSKWIALFEKEAPIASGFGFAQESRNGIKNFVVAANLSAESERYTVYAFDGKFYKASQCYVKDGTKTKSEPCK